MIRNNTFSAYKLIKPMLLPRLIVITGCIIGFLIPQSLRAQKPVDTINAIHLSSKQLKAFEGIFQSSANKDMYVEFTAGDNTLIAKLLWNNGTVHLLPEKELGFISKESEDEGPLHLIFTKDSSGTIAQLSIGNKDVWNRVKDYKPVIKKEMEHTTEQLKPFEGLYQLSEEKTRFIQFTVKNNNLILKQHWDGNELQFVPESELSFFCKGVPLFSLTFIKDKDGNIAQAIAFKRDIWQKVKKISPTDKQLSAIQGKYQSKDDADNYIQIISSNAKLVVKQLWDGKEIIVDPQTDTYFYNDDQSYPLQVIKDKNENIIQVLVLGIDLFNKVKE
jgi:hypothetical protein